MTATLAPSGRPVNPLVMWTDGRWIFVEIPSKTIPCIMKFALHDAGLWRALNVLQTHSYEWAGPAQTRDSTIGRPLDPKLAAAQKLLKDKGILR